MSGLFDPLRAALGAKPQPQILPEAALLPGCAVVIPVWNDGARLARLLDQIRAMGCFGQIVVVDDGSDQPVPEAEDLTLLRQRRSIGGGAARNLGLKYVRHQHVLFFDSDDLLTDELPVLLQDLAAETAAGGVFDFCLFRHADSRVAAEGRWGQPDWDDALWAKAGHGSGALAEASAAALPILVKTANYPWNKIYRTGFLRRHQIGCGQTRLHQDIELHWMGFLRADRVLVSDRICAWHAVDPKADRLTNRKGRERFEVFTALTPVQAACAGADDPVWRQAFADFVLGLLVWVSEQIEPKIRPELQALAARWLQEHLLPWQADLAGMPGLWDRVQAAARAEPSSKLQPEVDPAALPAATEGFSFIWLTRGLGADFWPLAERLAALALPGDQVILVEDGGADDSQLWMGRYKAFQGWGKDVALITVQAGHSRQSDPAGALNLALQRASGAQIMVISGRETLDPKAVMALRQGPAARAPVLRQAPVLGRDGRPCQDPLSLAGLIIPAALLGAGAGRLKADEALGDLGALALRLRLVLRAGGLQLLEGPAMVQRNCAKALAAPAAVLAGFEQLLRAEPFAGALICAAFGDWLRLAGQGAVAAVLCQVGPLAKALAPEVLRAAPAPIADLLYALREGDLPAGRAALRALTARPLPAPSLAGKPVKLWLEGRHSKRMPFAYPHLATLWQDQIIRADSPKAADLLIAAHPRDLAVMGQETADCAHQKPFALLSEEPFWDSLFSPDPFADEVVLWGGRAGHLRLRQLNHHTSAIYDFARIPYFLLTEPGYIAAYQRLFASNAARLPADWQAEVAGRGLRLAFMAERRPETFHDFERPEGDLIGLCAWRTRLAERPHRGAVARIGASWTPGAPPRQALQDWHQDKIDTLDGKVQILSALENTHQPNYISEKFFDAFALGAWPLYHASPGHRIHDLGLPETAWLNLWGKTEEAAFAAVEALDPEELPWRAYAVAQGQLAALFGDSAVIAAERARLRDAVLAEVQALV